MADASFLDRAGYWINLIYICSVCLTMMAGVVAVFVSHQRTALRDAELKRVQAESAQHIAAANRRSADAGERFVTANQHAAELDAAIAQAQSLAAAASLEQEELRQKNLQLSMDLERERRSKLELQERLVAVPPSSGVPGGTQSHLLTPEHEQTLAARMGSFSGTRVAMIELVEPGAARLAQQLQSAFTNAQWVVSASRVGALSPPQYGIICTHPPDEPAAAALVELLRSFNLTVYERSGEVFQIIVGLKPPK